MEQDNSKRINVGVTKVDRSKLKEISIEIFGRVNISATIAYLIRKHENERKENE